jgi:hypothetical protein
MVAERRLEILGYLLAGSGERFDTSRLCEVSAEVTHVSGAGIMLMAGTRPAGSVCSSNPVSAVIEQLQFALGEGPCIDAFRQRRPVLEADLARPSVRWPAFTGPALEAGVRSIFGFPLQIGAGRLGALDLYCEQPGPLSEQQHADALVMADIVTRAVLAIQADGTPGAIATDLETNADFNYVVHQAAGMVAAQLEVPIAEAFVRLRAHAFGNGHSLNQVARDVVARTLRFGDQGDETTET